MSGRQHGDRSRHPAVRPARLRQDDRGPPPRRRARRGAHVPGRVDGCPRHRPVGPARPGPRRGAAVVADARARPPRADGRRRVGRVEPRRARRRADRGASGRRGDRAALPRRAEGRAVAPPRRAQPPAGVRVDADRPLRRSTRGGSCSSHRRRTSWRASTSPDAHRRRRCQPGHRWSGRSSSRSGPRARPACAPWLRAGAVALVGACVVAVVAAGRTDEPTSVRAVAPPRRRRRGGHRR